MGIFSTLGNVLSGRNLNQNLLLNDNTMRLLGKSEAPEAHQFVKDWVYACTISTQLLLETLFFEQNKMTTKFGEVIELNQLKQHVHLLDREKAFEIYKLIGGHYLLVFLQGQHNKEFLKNIHLEEDFFKRQFFSVFDYTLDDVDYYEHLAQIPEENRTGYFLTIYDMVFTQGFGIPREKEIAGFHYFTQLLGEHYKIFWDILSERKRQFAEGN